VRFTGAGLHTLAGAYALHALDPGDEARFERHLARCDACAQEVRGLRETATRLGQAVAADPPQRLREQVLTAARRTRQVAPATRPGRRAVPVFARWPRWAQRLALAAAAVSVAVAAAAGVVAVTAQHRLAHEETGSSEVAAVLTAHDAHMMTAPVAGGGSATVVMSHTKRMLVLTTDGLRVLSGARSYELWLMGPDGDRSAGMLPRPQRGMTAPVVASGLATGDKVGLTVEPAAGSPRPSTAPVLMLPLSS
jgi:anti-sigma-K factor RskA